mmetsp:Transcript_4456/g.7323  ORF Transcript_4456/g.7323 Transcript_4456/m.7323 type:complete len:115 (-) Transcript_4456:819-1163(-)
MLSKLQRQPNHGNIQLTPRKHNNWISCNAVSCFMLQENHLSLANSSNSVLLGMISILQQQPKYCGMGIFSASGGTAIIESVPSKSTAANQSLGMQQHSLLLDPLHHQVLQTVLL